MAPRAQGGGQRSRRIEALGSAIFAMLEEAPDITLAKIAARPERAHGQRFATLPVLHYRQLSLKVAYCSQRCDQKATNVAFQSSVCF